MGSVIKAELIRHRGFDRMLVKVPFKTACKTELDFCGYNEESPNDSLHRIVEINAFNMMEIADHYGVFEGELLNVYKQMFGKRKSRIEAIQLRKGHQLFPFQEEGVKYLDHKRGRCLLADEMGLGKTIQVIAYLKAVSEYIERAIILSPAHVKLNWQDEFQEFWTAKHVEVIFGMKSYPIPPEKRILIVNPQLLKTWTPSLIAFGPQQLVIDEAHNFVNHKTTTYGFAETLCRATGKVILLTGTPLINGTDDLWGLLALINPMILGHYTRFVHRFCPQTEAQEMMKRRFIQRARTGFWGRKINIEDEVVVMPESDKKLLHRILTSTCMLRRLKKDVAPQLPKQIRKVIRIEIDDQAFWKAERELRKTVLEELRNRSTNGKFKADSLEKAMQSWARMRRLCGEAKFDMLCEWLDSFLNESSDKIVIAGWHKDLLYRLHEHYKSKSYLVTGDISSVKKHEISKEFQSATGKRMLFGNAKSIGTGINLTAANIILFCEMPLTGADIDQIEARIHRLSQKSDHVMYVYFTIKDTIEDKTIQDVSQKQGTSNAIIDGVSDGQTLEDVVDDSIDPDYLMKILIANTKTRSL